jgi:cytochrome c oxidase cbb3-type subunit III
MHEGRSGSAAGGAVAFTISRDIDLNNIGDRRRVHRIMTCALILSAGGWTNAKSPDQVAKAGQALSQQDATARQTFAGTCAGCHGLDGRGSERGPNIATRTEVRRLSDEELLRVLRNGVFLTGMPNFSALGDPQLQALVRYLRVLQGRSDAVPIPGDPRRGEALFFGRGQCSQCHMVNGQGGFIGSDLTAYGADFLPDEIRHTILNARDATGSASQVQVTLADGRVWDGVVRNEDNFSLQLQSSDGAFHLLQKSEAAAVKPSSRPLMPEDYGQLLSAAELDDIVGYLISVARSATQRAAQKQ